MTDALRKTLRPKLSKLIKFSVGALLLSTAAGAHAQSGNDTLKNTNYNISVGDVNGDGREDVLMKAMPRIVIIPLDDDLTIPIAIPAKTPSFALMSGAYWGYVLVSNPDAQLLQSNWSAANSGTLQFGVNGQHADTVRIQSASGEFVVAFSDVSQQLSLVQQPGVVKVPGTVTYIHTDGLGSPVARTNAAGQLLSRTLYEPYGYVAMGEAPTIGFTGHVNDADTGLTYMQQRYYDPVAGRFLSIDPVTTDANTGSSFNRYDYANGNPYKYVDPDGRAPWPIELVKAGINIAKQVVKVEGREAAKEAAKEATKDGSKAATSNAARREVMRKEGIPTSQQPVSQSTNASGREYKYEVPKEGGNTEIKSVQQQTMDRSHVGDNHWEAGKVKIDQRTGEIRETNYGRPKLQNDKSKVDY